MSEAFQPQSVLLGTLPWVTNTPLNFNFDALNILEGMAIPHVVSIDIEAELDPSYTTAPTLVGNNALFSNLSINDGLREWLPMGGSMNLLRIFERGETGGSLLPEVTLGGGTGNPRYVRRRFYWNPQNIKGQPADGAYNAPFLQAQGGRISAMCAALTAISADCTAAAGNINVYANVVNYYDKLIFPAYYTRQMLPVTNGTVFKQKALYGTIALLNSTAFDPFAVGDVGNVTLNFAGNIPLKAVPCPTLTAAFVADMRTRQFSIAGETRDATYDVAARQMNGTTPTAIEAVPQDLQMVGWLPWGCRLSKLAYFAPAQLTMGLTGSGTTTQAVLGRFEPVTAAERVTQRDTAMRSLAGRTIVDWGMRLLSGKTETTSPYRDFYPWEAKLNPTPH